MRARPIAVTLGTIAVATVIAHAERVAAKRMIRRPQDVSAPAFALAGRALGSSAPTTPLDAAGAAKLAGSAIAAIDAEALVIDADSGDLVRVGTDGKPRARLAIGPTASQLVYDPATGRAFVASRGTDEIVVVDVATLTATARWKTPTEPYGVALSPDGRLLLVTTVAARTLVAFDATTGAERWRRPTAAEPRGVAISPDGATAIVTSLTSGSVERITLATPQRETSISLSPAVTQASFGTNAVLGQIINTSEQGRALARSAFAARFIGNQLAMVAHQTSVPLQESRFGENRGSYGGGSEPPITHQVTFIATGGRVPRTVAAQIAEHQPKAIAWDPIHDRAFVVGYGSDTMLVLAGASQASVRFERSVSVGGGEGCGPEGVAVDSAGDAWVYCGVSRRIVRSFVGSSTDAKQIAGPVAIAPTRLSKEAHQGMDLFRRGNDGRISSRGAMACASCHPEAGTDGLSWRIEGATLQTPLLAGRVAGTHPYKWDGGDKDLNTSLTSTMRRLGGGGLQPAQTAALAAYLETLPKPRVPARDRAAVARGEKLFASDEVGCASCHGGTQFSDGEQHEFGGDLVKSDTPSLVGLARSAPYYHDGSAATLEALLGERAAVHGMAEMVSLTTAQRADLVAYLETL